MKTENDNSEQLSEIEKKAQSVGEMFTILDPDTLEPIGQEERTKVHKIGLLHRSVNVILYDKEKHTVLLQKRSEYKKVESGKWDVSCAEHLQGDESFHDAAYRGLKEELGMNVCAKDDSMGGLVVCLEKCGDAEKNRWIYKEIGIVDYELNELWVGVCGQDAKIQVDGVEVCEIRWVDIDALRLEIKNSPDNFTRWSLGYFKKFFEKLGIQDD